MRRPAHDRPDAVPLATHRSLGDHRPAVTTPGDPPLQLVPAREIWFVSAFIHAAGLDPHARAEALAAQLQRELRAFTAAQLARIARSPDLLARALELLRTITIRGA